MTDYHETVYPGAYVPDPATLIRFSDEAGARAKREEVLGFLYPDTHALPGRAPNLSWPLDEASRRVEAYQKGWTNLGSGELFWDKTGAGFETISFLGRAEDPRLNRLVIIVYGHGWTFEEGAVPYQDNSGGMRMGRHFVAAGFDVLMLDMPALGNNPKPTVFSPVMNAPVTINSHLSLWMLESGPYTPLVEYAEPVAVLLNQILADGSGAGAYDDVSFWGFSGGGWQATFCGALDERIKNTYCSSGSLPGHMLFMPPNDANQAGAWLDQEFEYRGKGDLGTVLYDQTTMLELYALAASGAGRSGRRFVQTFNRYDPVAFAGVNYRAYEQPLKDAIAKIGGGSYGSYSDENTQHTLSDGALTFVTEDLLKS